MGNIDMAQLGSMLHANAHPLTFPPPAPPGQDNHPLGSDGDDDEDDMGGNLSGGSGGRRGGGGRNATIGSDEWTRQRKDNHVCASGYFHRVILRPPPERS